VRRRAGCVCLGTLALVAGCSLFAPADDAPPTALLLDQVPANVPRSVHRGLLLRVEQPDARPVYDTTQMAYTLRAHQLAYYGRNQWAETPGQMLQPLLARTLQATGAFAAVRTQAGPESALTLHTEVTELLQDFTQEPPRARVALHVRLSDAAGRTVAERDIAQDEAMQAKNPYAGVVAANAALARALAAVAEFVVHALP
jgi:cholesterol transport system auxiliary component